MFHKGLCILYHKESASSKLKNRVTASFRHCLDAKLFVTLTLSFVARRERTGSQAISNLHPSIKPNLTEWITGKWNLHRRPCFVTDLYRIFTGVCDSWLKDRRLIVVCRRFKILRKKSSISLKANFNECVLYVYTRMLLFEESVTSAII